MIDYAKITVKAGDGGDGAGSFMHTKGKRRGKADGGDGGSGGNVFFVAGANLNTLEPFRFVKDYQARSGDNGLSNRRKGAVGEDLNILVPVGTMVKVTSQSEESENRKDYSLSTLTYDLVEVGQKILIARAGQGGRGNTHLRDEFGRRPFKGEKGEVGEKVALTLELKLIADVGLVGLPNAGKSTLIAALTSARPKIAPYPFTTLEPNLGILETGPVSDFLPASARSSVKSNGEQNINVELRADRNPPIAATRSQVSTMNYEPLTINKPARLVIADIPGLIEGASEGKGLGDLFLRHIERTKILVHMIDASASDDLWQAYQTVRNELKVYSRDLAKKQEIIVINKIDLVDEENLQKKIAVFKLKRKKVITVSALGHMGTDELILEIQKKLKA